MAGCTRYRQTLRNMDASTCLAVPTRPSLAVPTPIKTSAGSLAAPNNYRLSKIQSVSCREGMSKPGGVSHPRDRFHLNMGLVKLPVIVGSSGRVLEKSAGIIATNYKNQGDIGDCGRRSNPARVVSGRGLTYRSGGSGAGELFEQSELLQRGKNGKHGEKQSADEQADADQPVGTQSRGE